MNKRELKRLWRAFQKSKKEQTDAINAAWLANRDKEQAIERRKAAELSLAVAVAKYGGNVIVGGALYFTEGGELRVEEVKAI